MPIGVITAIGDAIASAVAWVAGSAAAGTGIAGAASGLGIGAATADTIGTIAAPALFGAAGGAGLSALTGGNPLTGALTGALSGGAIAGLGGVGGALTGALGGSATAADAILGAGAGAIGSAVTGQNALKGALYGGAAGGLTGYISGLSPGTVDSGTWDNTGQVGTYAGDAAAKATTDTASWDTSNGTGPSVSTDNGGPGQLNTNTGGLNAQSANTAAANAGSANSSGPLTKLLSNPAVMLGALAAASTALNKPAQGGYTVPGPTSATGNSVYANTPLAPSGTFPGATPLTPNVPNYYTYGAIPGGANYFANNNLAAYGFARGGAANENHEFTTRGPSRLVRGPGGPEDDAVPARLSPGEYVLDHRDVALIGRGSNERGARILDKARRKLNRGGGGALAALRSSA